MQTVNDLKELEQMAIERGLPTPLPVLEHSHKLVQSMLFDLDDPKLLKEHLIFMYKECMKSPDMDDRNQREQVSISFSYLVHFLDKVQKNEVN